MREFKRALQENPAVDLMDLTPDSYHQKHQKAQLKNLRTDAAKLNQKTINELQDILREDPEVNLISVLPPNYTHRLRFATLSSTGPTKPHVVKPQCPPDFRTRLDIVHTAEIVFPLSDNVVTILTGFSERSGGSMGSMDSMIPFLRQMLWNSPKLWENPLRGTVVKCSHDIVAKVVITEDDYTEYTTMQYLSERAPEIPAPKPNRLIKLGPFSVIFMSYTPGMTLTEAWPNLSHGSKLSVQHQLDGIFRRLRSLRKDDGHYLGGAGGEGVKDHPHNTVVSTVADFENKHSAPHHGSTAYLRFLCSFLTQPVQRLVFTHGDVRQDNILVRLNQDNTCVITGIIDWEESGFYPEYYECIQLTRTLSVTEENDWYLYLPTSIAPSRFPLPWLVDRLWDIHVKTT